MPTLQDVLVPKQLHDTTPTPTIAKIEQHPVRSRAKRIKGYRPLTQMRTCSAVPLYVVWFPGNQKEEEKRVLFWI
jgi:hypothetical protein